MSDTNCKYCGGDMVNALYSQFCTTRCLELYKEDCRERGIPSDPKERRIAELEQEIKESEELLIQYMRHVISCESISFLESHDYHNVLSEDEILRLKKVEAEARDAD